MYDPSKQHAHASDKKLTLVIKHIDEPIEKKLHIKKLHFNFKYCSIFVLICENM